MAAILDYVTGPQHHCDLCTVQDRSMYEHKRCARTRVYDFYARVYGLTPEITTWSSFYWPKELPMEKAIPCKDMIANHCRKTKGRPASSLATWMPRTS